MSCASWGGCSRSGPQTLQRRSAPTVRHPSTGGIGRTCNASSGTCSQAGWHPGRDGELVPGQDSRILAAMPELNLGSLVPLCSSMYWDHRRGLAHRDCRPGHSYQLERLLSLLPGLLRWPATQRLCVAGRPPAQQKVCRYYRRRLPQSILASGSCRTLIRHEPTVTVRPSLNFPILRGNSDRSIRYGYRRMGPRSSGVAEHQLPGSATGDGLLKTSWRGLEDVAIRGKHLL